MSEEDPKEVARKERKTPEVEKHLRQFMNIDGPKGTSKAYRDNFDLIFNGEDCGKCRRRFLRAEMRDCRFVTPTGYKPGYICKDCFSAVAQSVSR